MWLFGDVDRERDRLGKILKESTSPLNTFLWDPESDVVRWTSNNWCRSDNEMVRNARV